MVQNILGNGIDIPLLGLREASRDVEGDYHELFTDEGYKTSQCFLLSTSQVKAPLSKSDDAVKQSAQLIRLKALYVPSRIHFCTIKVETEQRTLSFSLECINLKQAPPRFMS